MKKNKMRQYDRFIDKILKSVSIFIILIVALIVLENVLEKSYLNNKKMKISNKYDIYYPLLIEYTEAIKNNTSEGLEKTEKYFENKKSILEQGVYESIISYYYGKSSNYNLQKHHNLRAIELFEKDDEAIKILIKIYSYTITNAVNNKDYAFALEYIYKALEDINYKGGWLIDSDFIKDFYVRLQCNTIIMFVNNNLVDRVEPYFNELMKLDVNSEEYKNNKSNIIYSKILYYDANGDFKELLDASYEYYEDAIENGSKNLDGLRLNIGKALIANGKIDEGFNQLKVAGEFYSNNGGPVEKGELSYAFAIYYEAINDYEKAFEMYESAYNIFKTTVNDNVKANEIIKKIYAVNKKLGNINDVTKYNDEYYRYTSDNKNNKTIQLLKTMDEINNKYLDLTVDLKNYEEVTMKKANAIKGVIIIILLFTLCLLIAVLDSLKNQVEENRLYEQKLKEIIDKDNLSKCYSRVKGISIIEDIISRRDNLILAMLDIDNFKKINDSQGHIYGDKVIKIFGEILLEIGDKKLFPIRYGGEEFIIAYNGNNVDDFVRYLEGVSSKLSEANIIEGVSITFSGGVSKWNGESLEELINNADKKLYEAKLEGKNKIVI